VEFGQIFETDPVRRPVTPASLLDGDGGGDVKGAYNSESPTR